jgi:hypothetical protein
MIALITINAATVIGKPRGKNQTVGPVIMSIKYRAVRIVSIRTGTIMKGLLCANRKSVTIIHTAAIDTSDISDHFRLLFIVRSTIVQTAIPEKAEMLPVFFFVKLNDIGRIIPGNMFLFNTPLVPAAKGTYL